MKREAHPAFSSLEGHRAHAHSAYTLQSREDLPAVTMRTSLSDLHQFRAGYESGWSIEQDKPPFPPQAVASPPVDPLLQVSANGPQAQALTRQPSAHEPETVSRLGDEYPGYSMRPKQSRHVCPERSRSSQIREREGGILWQRTESFLY